MQVIRTVIALLLIASLAGTTFAQVPRYQVAPGVVAQPSASDLGLSITPTTGPPYTVGQTVTLRLVVTNMGPSTAEDITVSAQPTNFNVQSVRGFPGCTAFPCRIPALRVKQLLAADIVASIVSAGAFVFDAQVTFRGRDPNSSNDQVYFRGSTQQPKPPSVPVPKPTPAPTYPSTATKVPGTPIQAPAKPISQPSGTQPPPPQTSTAQTPVQQTSPAQTPPAQTLSVSEVQTKPDVPAVQPASDHTYNPPAAATIQQHPPAQAPVLVATVSPPAPYSVGQAVTIVVTLNGADPGVFRSPQMHGAATNLRFEGANSGCILQPCTMEHTSTKTSYRANLVGTVVAAGPFGYTATVQGAQQPATAKGSATTGSWRWLYIVALLGIGAILTRPLRRRWWRSRIKVQTSVRLHPTQSACTPLAFTTPAIHLRILLPPGVTASGPFTLSRKEVLHV